MSTTALEHPLAEAGADGWVATELHSPVVWLSSGLSDLLASAAAERRRLVLVTPVSSRLTLALSETLRSLGGAWVIRTADGFFDAATGRRIEQAHEALALPQSSTGAVHPEALGMPLVSSLQLSAVISTRHRVTRRVLLGGAAESSSLTFTRTLPRSWGAIEPLTAAWDREQLTEYIRARMPLQSRLGFQSVGAHRSVGTVEVARTSEGLEEITRVTGDLGGLTSERAKNAPAIALDLLRAASASGLPLFGVALARTGSPDLTRRAILSAQGEPVALLFGAPAVRALGLDAAKWAREHGATLLGSARIPSLLIPLASADRSGWQRLREVASSLDITRLTDVVSVTPGVIEFLDTIAAAQGNTAEGNHG